MHPGGFPALKSLWVSHLGSQTIFVPSPRELLRSRAASSREHHCAPTVTTSGHMKAAVRVRWLLLWARFSMGVEWTTDQQWFGSPPSLRSFPPNGQDRILLPHKMADIVELGPAYGEARCGSSASAVSKTGLGFGSPNRVGSSRFTWSWSNQRWWWRLF